MISFKGRESKRGRIYKMSRNLERLYKEGKCRECRVLVTRMDFAKILGKFTKVKIQYESSSSHKPKKNVDSNLAHTNSISKCSENGLTQKNSHKKQATKTIRTPKNSKVNDMKIIPDLVFPECDDESKNPHPPSNMAPSSNILKENNGLTKQQLHREKNNYIKKVVSSGLKQYGIIFTSPTITNNNNNSELKIKLSLLDLLPDLNKSILPTEEWHIDYFPKTEEPKDDKVYDRIAAELEDLMYNEKPIEKLKPEGSEMKVEEFPSIMDILNDNIEEKNPENIQKEKEQSCSESLKDNLESNDVEAMLLGKPNVENKDSEPMAMDVDSSDVSKLIEDMDQLNSITDNSKDKDVNDESLAKSEEKVLSEVSDTLINPNSPSILDEALKKGIEEHLPNENQEADSSSEVNNLVQSNDNQNNESTPGTDIKLTQVNENIDEDVPNTKSNDKNVNASIPNNVNVTHVVFKKMLGDKCFKSVTCPKNLKYSIELEGKPVEFIGAPKYISSLEDLQVLLQIVNESELGSLSSPPRHK